MAVLANFKYHQLEGDEHDRISRYPAIDVSSIANTKNTLHAYARLMGHCLKHGQDKHKH